MSKAYVFTWNNYTDDSLITVDTIECSYIVYGKEVGESGTPHLQGYIEFAKQKKFNTVKNLLKGAHIELRRGSQDQAINYCMKDGDSVERGVRAITRPGKRTDIDNARDLAKAGGMRLVTKKVQSQQAMNIASKYLEYNEQERDWKPYVTWIWGDSGTGKSRLAHSALSASDVYTKNDGTKWWNGYDGHEDVIIDDFRDSWWPITEMLSLLDRYGKRVEVKGGVRQFLAKSIIITSIFPPDQCYRGCGNEPVAQILRRIDHTIHLELPKPPVEEVEEVRQPVEEVYDDL